ncbi:MAG TPA: ceramidase domain-containing protein [Burkholderiales bacterium]|nr:ceramidase domain-containing protein [Burkholderiales bacterium]
MSHDKRNWREWTLMGLVLVPLALILTRPRMPQDAKFHALVDTRTYLGIPNFLDTASNLPFLLLGIAGLLLCGGRTVTGGARSWLVFFVGVTLVFFGSAYYHWSPNNATLVWDRVPITIALMGLLVAVVSEHAGAGLERILLAPALTIGIGSVAWWVYTDDLRSYVWVQAAPLVAIVFVLIAYAPRHTCRAYLAYALACYTLAKAAEFQDREIYALTSQTLSGHTLKHLLAAAGILFLYLMLRRRTPIRPEVPAPATAIQ